MDDVELSFDFEKNLDAPNTSQFASGQAAAPPDIPPGAAIGQQPANFKKNFRKTVCTYWLRGLCMKGDTCGFLHQFDSSRMPVCRSLLKYGVCKEPDCPYKHTLDDIQECNMYKLGFCVYGPQCRYKHTRMPGPPPPPDTVEAAKPREMRNINAVVTSANANISLGEYPLRRRGGGQRLGGRGGPYQRLPGPSPPGYPPNGAMVSFQGGLPPPRPPPGAPPMGNMPAHIDAQMLAAVGQQNLPYGF